jgi:hypothetical protein
VELRRHLGEVFRRLAEQKESRIEEGQGERVLRIHSWAGHRSDTGLHQEARRGGHAPRADELVALTATFRWPQTTGAAKAIAKRLALDGREHGSRLCWFGWDRSLPLHFCYRPDLFLRLSVGKTTTIPRGAHHQARTSRHKLVFGRSVRIATLMQSCASAAKLRGGGPITNRGSIGFEAERASCRPNLTHLPYSGRIPGIRP